MNTFYIAVYGDGALFGGSDAPWHLERMVREEEEWTIFEMKDTLPKDLREKCEEHGTSGQWFSDGYEGYDAVKEFIQAVWDTNLEECDHLIHLHGAPEDVAKNCFNL